MVMRQLLTRRPKSLELPETAETMARNGAATGASWSHARDGGLRQNDSPERDVPLKTHHKLSGQSSRWRKSNAMSLEPDVDEKLGRAARQQAASPRTSR